MKGIHATILGTVICLAALATWVYLAPVAGSGWILVFTFFATLGFLSSIRDPKLGVFAALTIVVVTAFTWYFNRDVSDAWAVLGLSILSGFTMLDELCTMVSLSTTYKGKKSTKSNKK